MLGSKWLQVLWSDGQTRRPNPIQEANPPSPHSQQRLYSSWSRWYTCLYPVSHCQKRRPLSQLSSALHITYCSSSLSTPYSLSLFVCIVVCSFFLSSVFLFSRFSVTRRETLSLPSCRSDCIPVGPVSFSFLVPQMMDGPISTYHSRLDTASYRAKSPPITLSNTSCPLLRHTAAHLF